MSYYTGTQSEVLYAGPPANFPAAAASSAAAQSLVTGATGDYSQPLIPGGFWQMGRQNQLISVEFSGVVSGQSSATYYQLTLGSNTAANTIGGSTLITIGGTGGASNEFVCTSLTNAFFYGKCLILCRGAGYGTSSVSTNLLTTGWANMSSPVAGSGAPVTIAGAPTTLQTLDSSVNNWLYLTVTFSTSSASNSMTLESLVVRGEN